MLPATLREGLKDYAMSAESAGYGSTTSLQGSVRFTFALGTLVLHVLNPVEEFSGGGQPSHICRIRHVGNFAPSIRHERCWSDKTWNTVSRHNTPRLVG